ncbi:MAG TPA: glutathione S-transferase family protein [Geminicoccaceae bacterium]|nr:glutathione S-transferase family protein [Geminicoccaceae bacterium]
MLRLYHFPVCPFCRKVRVVLREKELAAELQVEEPWRRRPEFVPLNPAVEVPVLEDGPLVVSDSAAICEYLEDAYPDRPLLGATLEERAETRRLVAWFDVKFNREVTDLLWREKLVKRLRANAMPNSAAVRAGLANLRGHLEYVAYLIERRNWLAGDGLSLADIAAAAHISVVDYLGDVPWDDFPESKLWYARIKSRPSFRPLLTDRLVGIAPPLYYDDPDF